MSFFLSHFQDEYEFDEEFASALNDPEFCKEFETLFVNEIQQKPVVQDFEDGNLSETLLEKHSRRRRIRKRYERFDEKFAKTLDDPKFCEAFLDFFLRHVQQKPAVMSDVSYPKTSATPEASTNHEQPNQVCSANFVSDKQKSP